MQAYTPQFPTSINQEDQVHLKNKSLEAPDTQSLETIKGLQADVQAPSPMMLPQPGAEPSPLMKPEPEPQRCRAHTIDEPEPSPTHKNEEFSMELLPELASGSDSEPASEPSVAIHKTIPEALFKTNLASLRFRKSPYFEATLRWGVKSFQPYNHILMPQIYSSEEDECENLRNNVCLWDVTCEQQIEIVGEDALQLADMLTPRMLHSMKVGEARYAVMTDEDGMVINDPVVLKIAEDRYWFSIADQDMLYWIKGIALGKGLKVKVSQPDVSPLAVQGPKSLPLMKIATGSLSQTRICFIGSRALLWGAV